LSIPLVAASRLLGVNHSLLCLIFDQ
jgi:hypothetical protein